MLLCARKRRPAAHPPTVLVVGLVLAAAVPETAAAAVVPLGAPLLTRVAAAPRARAARRCAGGGARRVMLCLVNRARASAGLPPLRAERHLARAASRHAADMRRRHYFGHVSPSGRSPLARIRAAGWHGAGVGEVIAWGCGSLSTPGATLRAWLRSPPHRAILLGRGHAAGVGVKRTSGCGGGAYWVIDVA